MVCRSHQNMSVHCRVCAIVSYHVFTIDLVKLLTLNCEFFYNYICTYINNLSQINETLPYLKKYQKNLVETLLLTELVKDLSLFCRDITTY